MADRQAVIDQFKAKLDQWDAELDELEAKARGASAEARANLHEQIAKLKDQRGEARTRFDALRSSTDDAWQELQTGAQQAADALGDSLRAAREKFSA